MKQIDNLLIPEEGLMLTQAIDMPIESRIVTDRVYLAVNDSADMARDYQ